MFVATAKASQSSNDAVPESNTRLNLGQADAETKVKQGSALNQLY